MLTDLLKKAEPKIRALLPNKFVSWFVKHNNRVFARTSGKYSSSPIVLMEMNQMHSAHIAYSYLANALAQEYNALIIGYQPYKKSRLRSIGFYFCKIFNLDIFRVYRSFGTVNFLKIETTDLQRINAIKIFNEIFEKLVNKRDIELINIHGILIGDLIYDMYLRLFNKPTIDKNIPQFRNLLLEFIESFLFWEQYLDSHNVVAINVSHCVYNNAIPLRLGIERNIPVFQANAQYVYRLSKKNYFANCDFYYFRELFAGLPGEVQKNGIVEARRRIQRRFAGEVGVDMDYSTKSAYTVPHNVRLLRESSKKKVLIASHCFYDSPHCYGINIFPDFYEWLNFLGTTSEETDYDWYIKVHPDYLPGTMEIIQDFVSKYPNITLLPADSSHHQIIAEGIDVALTVYGTIAFEYAVLGIPVINCSLCNPHIAYDFNLHPRNVEDYRFLLHHLESLHVSIDKQQVYEYYFMANIFGTEDIFFKNYRKAIKDVGGYYKQFTPYIYERWKCEWSPGRHNSITSAIQGFIRSDDYRLDYHHYDRDLFFESN